MNLSRMLLSILGFTATLYVLFCLALYFMQDQLIFMPPSASESLYGPWQAQAYQLDTGSHRLQGWMVPGGADDGIIVYFGGNAEDVAYNLYDAERYAAGHLVLTNYAGYGHSEGQPSQKVFFADALAVFDHVREHFGVDGKQIYVMGRSIGSAVASHVAANRPVAGLILVTPFDSVKNVAAHYYPWFPVGLLLNHPFSTLDVIGDIEAPVLIVEAGQDEIIPRKSLQRLHRAAPDGATLATVGEANHQNITVYDSYFERINDFIEKGGAAH